MDVGQGDGAFIVTPDDEFALIDAGESDNMRRFLSWRFNLKLDQLAVEEDDAHEVNPRSIPFKFAVISHSDLDHYQGFKGLFTSTQFHFTHIYHNTLVERPAERKVDMFGERRRLLEEDCVVELVETPEQLTAVLAQFPDPKTKYLQLLRSAVDSGRVGSIVGLTSDARHLEDFGVTRRTAGGKPLHIEVLGPIPLVDEEVRGLPTFGSAPGVTKNGHSVVLRIKYGDLRFLLGGDLNTPAEEHLLKQRTGREAPDMDAGENVWRAYLAQAREAFGADVAKSCHHGSADFSTTFLRAINATATVISSGDEEPHSHPRPDALGAIGGS